MKVENHNQSLAISHVTTTIETMRLILIVLASLFLANPEASAVSLGVGLFNPFDKTQDGSGQDQSDPVSPTISLSHSWNIFGTTSFAPVVGYTQFTNNTNDRYGGSYSVDSLYILYDFLTPLSDSGDLSLRWGLGSIRKQISGDGGQVTIPNGSGTADVYKPSISKPSSTVSLNLGLDYRFGVAGLAGTDQGVRLEFFVIQPLDKIKRTLALSFNYVLYF